MVKMEWVKEIIFFSVDSGQTVPGDHKDYFQVSDELSRENSHFALSEALLTVIEQVLL